MKKKVVSLLLASVMVLSLVACGDTKTPANSEGTSGAAGTTESSVSGEAEAFKLESINMVVNGTLTATVENGQAEFEKQWEDAVGVDLQIQQLDHSGYVDAVGRLFAGGDTPDVIIMSADMYAQYAPTGLLWDMTEAYENADFQARMTLPSINENLKKNGVLYGFAPTMGNGCVSYVKQAWLDAVGLTVDDIKTYDDYYNMLMKFHNEDPDGNGINGDTYGVIAAGFVGNEAPYINYLPEFWQDSYPAVLQDDAGEWYDGFQSEETKAALLRMQQAYADGAIDPETLTASTKIAREKWFSADQAGSAGVFTYWAGTWYQNLTDNLTKNSVDSTLVQLPPIAELDGYIDREAPVWCIIDDNDGDNAREQAIFDTFIETMMDGDVVQTLWTYGAEDVHWSTKAEDFVIYPDDPDKRKEYSYEEGVFHTKQSPNDPNTVWKKNHIDAALAVCPLTNGFSAATELAEVGNVFFSEYAIPSPLSPSSEAYTNETGTIYDAKLAVITEVVVNGGDVETAMQGYVDAVGSIIDQVLTELNAE